MRGTANQASTGWGTARGPLGANAAERGGESFLRVRRVSARQATPEQPFPVLHQVGEPWGPLPRSSAGGSYSQLARKKGWFFFFLIYKSFVF